MAKVKDLPFKDLIFLQERMGRIFDDALSQYTGQEDGSKCGWSPPTDIYETEKNLILKVELPGVDAKDVSVEINDSLLTLKGQRKMRSNVEGEHYHRMEFSYGFFQRNFTLPVAVEEKKIKAKYKDGVLEVNVPKAKTTSTRQIKVDIK